MEGRDFSPSRTKKKKGTFPFLPSHSFLIQKIFVRAEGTDGRTTRILFVLEHKEKGRLTGPVGGGDLSSFLHFPLTPSPSSLELSYISEKEGGSVRENPHKNLKALPPPPPPSHTFFFPPPATKEGSLSKRALPFPLPLFSPFNFMPLPFLSPSVPSLSH